jgi:hypothetical protein
MRKSVIAVLAGACLSAAVEQPVVAQGPWDICEFNGRKEQCMIAGGSSSFTITFRSDGKQIEVEKVGEPYSCGADDRHECGKMLITEPREGRTTLATYQQTSSHTTIRSERGNVYVIPY